jgi:hypothetical protein
LNNKSNAPRPRAFGIQDIKRLILVLSISSTFSLWALFSNKWNLNPTQAVSGNEVATGSVPPIQTEDMLALDLPPIPTLIPTTNPSASPTTSTDSRPIQTPVALQPTAPAKKVVQNKPKPTAKRPAPVATTRSSQ